MDAFDNLVKQIDVLEGRTQTKIDEALAQKDYTRIGWLAGRHACILEIKGLLKMAREVTGNAQREPEGVPKVAV